MTFYSGGAQDGLDKLIKNPDSKLLNQFQTKVDRFFGNDWKYESLTAEEIDHFKKGYVLTWSKKVDSLVIKRSYSFDLASKLYYTHEQRFLGDKLISQGFVHFKGDTLDYINVAFTETPSTDFNVAGYSYEIYKNGVLSCVYKSKSRNHYDMLFQNRTDKVELVKGEDCLAIMK